MLTAAEKAYCEALIALRRKEYDKAVMAFEKGADQFGTNGEFNLLYQTDCLLVEVKKELAENGAKSMTEKKEMTING